MYEVTFHFKSGLEIKQVCKTVNLYFAPLTQQLNGYDLKETVGKKMNYCDINEIVAVTTIEVEHYNYDNSPLSNSYQYHNKTIVD